MANGFAAIAIDWQGAKQQFLTAPFDSIREPLTRLIDDTEWPGIARLNTLAAGINNFRGRQIRFVANEDASSTTHYETRIAETREVPTRDNWHDLFNALQWLAFPHLKSAINAQHARLLAAGGTAEAVARSAPRDVLTMFDESGIIVASRDASLLGLIRKFGWHELFVTRRDEVIANMRFVLVGHGLLEKSLAPFVGMTAKAMLLSVDANEFALDRAAADWLMDDTHLADSHHLAPLPLLGIPGWDPRNESPAFYDNANYFRPGRRR